MGELREVSVAGLGVVKHSSGAQAPAVNRAMGQGQSRSDPPIPRRHRNTAPGSLAAARRAGTTLATAALATM
ncbi:MAG: hypothetical protein KJ061_14955, partial [Vicinamibacteraceae bacterium]|nr:hypothetical protein [Vicinamibacteraceae bacterium]